VSKKPDDAQMIADEVWLTNEDETDARRMLIARKIRMAINRAVVKERESCVKAIWAAFTNTTSQAIGFAYKAETAIATKNIPVKATKRKAKP